MFKKINSILKKNKNWSSILENLVPAVFEALCFMILARSFSTELFGEWIFYISLLTLIDQLQIGFVWIALIKYLSSSITEKKQNAYSGSGWVLGILISVGLFILCYVFLIFFRDISFVNKFQLFFKWYPLYSLSSLSFRLAVSRLRAFQKFKKIIILRIVSYLLFVTTVFINYFFFWLSVDMLALVHALSFSVAGIIAIITGDSGIKHIICSKCIYIKKIIKFGKFSLGTTIGSNLLKNTDIFLIKLLMTNTQLALYSIPLRILETLNIPVNSLCNVAFPQMSAADKKNDKNQVLKIFYEYGGSLTFYLIPVLITMFFMAGFLIFIIGGDLYKSVPESSYVLYLFLVAGILLPFDRFSGTLLDSINRPEITFKKVTIMVLINLIGDVIAILVFNSIVMVALSTVLNMLIGNVYIYFYLKKNYNITIITLLESGFSIVRKRLRKIINDRLL